MDAHFDCRAHKRNTASALAWEMDLVNSLIQLDSELEAGTYRPGPSTWFVVKKPKAREVTAASYRDRVVHHLLYNKIGKRFEDSFIADTCACIKGRGTLVAAKRLEAKIRSATENWSRPLYYLKCDLASFFVAIDKRVLRDQLHAKITEPWWRWLTDVVLLHDPRPHAILQSTPAEFALIPPHKSLFNQPPHLGLPIGNLSSQFFANVYLDSLDQFVKHRLGVRHYVRYVDDFILLHESADFLNDALAQIAAFLPAELGARLNPRKTILQRVDRGVDFVGHVIKPWRRITRPRTKRVAMHNLATMPAADLFESANSYFGLLRQASHSHNDRADMAKLLRQRGFAVNRTFTQTYRKGSA